MPHKNPQRYAMIPHRWIVCVWIALFCVLWLPLWLTAKSAVEVTEVKYGNLPHIESFIGSLYFKETSSIASSSDGIVKNIFFNIGQKVKKGQKLLSVDSDLLLQDITIKQSKITDAQYTLERQKNELERYKSLLQSQSISIQQYENLQYEFKSQEARITALKAELEISKTMLKHKTIYAPFDGIIVDQKIHIGEWVQVGQAICQILNSKDTEVIIDTPSAVAKNLKPNQKVSLLIDSKTYNGIITAIIPKADMLSRTFPVHISLSNDGSFLDGMAAQAFIDISWNQKGFIVPRDSIVYHDGKPFVFIMRDNKAISIEVTLISTQNSLALIQGKLKENDLIISRGQDNLKNGAEIEVKNKR